MPKCTMRKVVINCCKYFWIPLLMRCVARGKRGQKEKEREGERAMPHTALSNKIVLNMQRNLNMRLTDTANMTRSCGRGKGRAWAYVTPYEIDLRNMCATCMKPQSLKLNTPFWCWVFKINMGENDIHRYYLRAGEWKAKQQANVARSAWEF